MGKMGEASERTCIVTRVTMPVDALVRFVVAPDGSIAPDLRHRLPGRGVWVTAERWAVEAAVNKRLFGKALDGVTTVDGERDDGAADLGADRGFARGRELTGDDRARRQPADRDGRDVLRRKIHGRRLGGGRRWGVCRGAASGGGQADTERKRACHSEANGLTHGGS